MPPHGGCFASPHRPMPERQPLFAVQTVDELLPHGPAFAIQQHPNLPVAIAHGGLGELIDPLPKGRAGIPMTAIPIGDPRVAGLWAGTTFANRRRLTEIGHSQPPLPTPYHCSA